MIHILLIILKIIGILLLVVLGLLLSVLVCILFVPVRYYGKIKYDTKHREIHFKAKYLLGLIRLKADMSGKDISYSFKILFKELIKSKADEDEEYKEKKKKTKHKKDNISKTKEIKKDDDNSNNISKTVEEDNINNSDKTYCITEHISNDNISAEDTVTENTVTENKLKQLYHKVLNFIIKIIDFIVNIRSKIIDFVDRLRNINQRKQEYLEFLRDEKSKEAIQIIKDLLLKTGKHIIPKKIKGKLKFGTGSPDTTGKLLGIISLFCNNYLKKVKIEADFDNKVFEGDIKFNGRIRGIILLVNAIKLYKVKRLREFINFVRK